MLVELSGLEELVRIGDWYTEGILKTGEGKVRRECKESSIKDCREDGENGKDNEEFKWHSDNLRDKMWIYEKSFTLWTIGGLLSVECFKQLQFGEEYKSVREGERFREGELW